MTTAEITEMPMAAKSGITPAEWQARVDLAACYRIVAHYGMTDMLNNHISVRVPDEPGRFLINPFGLFYEEVTASNLVKVDIEGNIIGNAEYGINPAGFVIHAAVHRGRHDLACVIHTHTRAGVAVSAQRRGLLPISQHALRFYNRIAYHDFEGLALDLDEQQRLIADLGSHKVMLLRNHGILAGGASVREAFEMLYYLEMACKIQIDILSGGQEPIYPSPEVCERTASQWDRSEEVLQGRDWPAIMRLLDRKDSSFRS